MPQVIITSVGLAFRVPGLHGVNPNHSVYICFAVIALTFAHPSVLIYPA